MRNKIWLMFLCGLLSCKSGQVISDQEFNSFLRKTTASDYTRLKQGGYFNNVTRAAYWNKLYAEDKQVMEKDRGKKVICPEIFFGNGVFVDNENIQTVDELLIPFASGVKYKSELGWGMYHITGDSITLLVHDVFPNHGLRIGWDRKIVKWQGLIENDSTIVQWRQVPPYLRNQGGKMDTIPARLEFHPYAGVKQIDSNRIFANRPVQK